MPIKVQNGLPVKKILEDENIFVMDENRAMHQDIRPLQILILNLMPTKVETETQLTRLLGNTPLQVELELLQTSTHKATNISEEHMIAFYKTFSQIKHKNYDGMIIFAVVGAAVNFIAAYFTHGGHSKNQKAVNLHMLEDVLGWIVVLAGSIVIKFTGFTVIDPVMSIGVGVFILINAFKSLKEIADIFLEKTPENVNIAEITKHIENIEGIKDVHHIHVRTIDGNTNFATMHLVTNEDGKDIKSKVRAELKKHGICHATLETEREDEICENRHCRIEFSEKTK